MPRYFDEDDEEFEKPSCDKELTLGTGALIAIPLALLLLCGFCFGFGYLVGHRSSAPNATARSSARTAAPDQEPLQASGMIPKPSAAEGAPVPQPAAASDSGQPAGGANGTAPAQGTAPVAAASVPASSQASPAAQPQVRPALGASPPAASQPATAPAVRAALPAAQSFMVQIAAVVNAEDANVLTQALRNRGYAVSARREPVDGMIHVRIGPFNSRDEANRWRDKLLGDGYNAVVQP